MFISSWWYILKLLFYLFHLSIKKINVCTEFFKKKILTWAGVGREFLFQSCAIIKKKNRQIIIKLKRKLKKNLLIYSQITKDTFPLVVREREKKKNC